MCKTVSRISEQKTRRLSAWSDQSIFVVRWLDSVNTCSLDIRDLKT